MKIKGNGQGKILTHEELVRLFAALDNPRDRCLFAICFFAACRISEALQLETSDIKSDMIVFRKGTTKGKLKTRAMAIHPQLQTFLSAYIPKKSGLLFPSGYPGTRYPHLSRNSADRIFKAACKQAGIVGASTHSFRRTALTQMSKLNVPLRTIQEISGHTDLGTLQRYLEVSPEDVKLAINNIRL